MLLLDVDFIRKICSCDLAAECLACLSAKSGSIYTLPSTRFTLGINRPVAWGDTRFGQDANKRIRAFVPSCKEINWTSQKFATLLTGVSGIDSGELALLAATDGHSAFTIATGDKKCIKALASEPKCLPVAKHVTGKVVCFEQAICRCIKLKGFTHVCQCVCPALSCDGALGNAFCHGPKTAEKLAVQKLEDYIAKLRSLPIDLLAI